MNLRGQITIFVILAILIVTAIALVFILYNNQISDEPVINQDKTLDEYEDCINDYVSEASELIYENGGFLEMPQLNYLVTNTKGYYRQEKVETIPYLCYTALNYARCTPQIPLIVEHFENQIKEYISSKVEFCFELVKSNLDEQAYQINAGVSSNLDVELRERAILTRVDKVFTQSRAGNEEKFEKFSSRLSSPLYEVARVVRRIVDEEALQCNSDYVQIMHEFPGINIRKFNADDGVSVYTIEDTKTDKEFKFAIRTCKQATPS